MTNTQKLAKLVQENPNLEIKIFTHYEACGSDDYHWWLTAVHNVSIEEIYHGDKYGDNERIYIKSSDSDDFMEYVIENNLWDDSKEKGWSDDELHDKAEEIYISLPWQKVILVWVRGV